MPSTMPGTEGLWVDSDAEVNVIPSSRRSVLAACCLRDSYCARCRGVIASGGGGSADDLAQALDDGPAGGHCQAALAASIFHFHETTVPDVKRRLLELGIPVRRPAAAAG